MKLELPEIKFGDDGFGYPTASLRVPTPSSIGRHAPWYFSVRGENEATRTELTAKLLERMPLDIEWYSRPKPNRPSFAPWPSRMTREDQEYLLVVLDALLEAFT